MKRRVNGVAVQVIRVAIGISQTALAARADLSKSTLSHVENSGRQVSPATLRKIADGLGVPLEAISYPEFVQSVAA